MINTFLSAKLVDYYTIKVCIFSNVEKTDYYPIKLIKNNENPTELIISKHKFLSGIQLFECKSNNKIELGNNYLISIDSFGIVPLDVSDATSFADFDEEYFYNENDLGFTYSKKKTTFKIWAPLASNVSLYIKNNDTRFITYKMSRAEKGIYFITLEGDYDSAAYRFLVTNNGISQFAADPYAKASSANGKYSYVVDLEKTKCDFFEYNLKRTNNYSSATIYELHVRDFTIDKNTDIVNKGKFLGLTEENRHTLKNNPAGIDYLKFLGITHVQLLPIFDYKTVNELKADEEYNWGYDPHQFFVPEGSYSTKPDDPYSRIVECKKMIQSLHKKGIKVNLDVVYNHVYDYSNSIFEKVVPNYYFRKNKSGLLSNGSFCGNELDSQRPMVRKLIIDSCLYWIKEYGIDGYRFDLMGLIDVDTMKRISNMCKDLKSDFMIYGEGWNMPSVLKEEDRSSLLNTDKLENIAFFNDAFRDILRGPNGNGGKGKEAGYLLGNIDYLEGFKFVFLGSSINYCFKPKFLNPNQSINYVECHDNLTLFDKIKCCLNNIDDSKALNITKLVNATICFCFGIPFYHAGQEIGLSKFGEDNTYNMGDKYNRFDWKLLDNRFEMANYLSSLINYRNKFNIIENVKTIEENNIFINYDNGCLGILINSNITKDNTDKLFVINPSNKDTIIYFDSVAKLFLNDSGLVENSDEITFYNLKSNTCGGFILNEK